MALVLLYYTFDVCPSTYGFINWEIAMFIPATVMACFKLLFLD